MRLAKPLFLLWLALFVGGCPDGQADRIEQLRAEREARRAARQETRAARVKARAHDWPPKAGELYPDLLLFDAAGEEVRLSTLAGKTLLIHLAAMSSPGTVAYTGGAEAAPFAGCGPQQGQQTLEAFLKKNRLDPAHPELRIVHVLFYGKRSSEPPTADDLKEWIAHFQLDERPNTLVLRGDEAYQEEATYDLVPGLQLVGPDMRLLADCGRHSGNSWLLVVRALRELQRPAVPEAPEPRPDPLAELRARLQERLLAKDFVELEAELEAQRRRGRREGRLRTWLQEADHLVYTRRGGELLAPEHLDAWVDTRPDSWLASYVRGLYRIRVGWNARGNGLAGTVSQRGWQVFGEQLTLAHGDLERAHEIHPDQPYAATALLTVARARTLPPARMQAYFEAALRADPGYVPAYELALEYLKPKWHGSTEVAFGFVESARAQRADDPAMEALTLNLHEEMMRAVQDKRSYLRHPEVKQAVERAGATLLKHFPQAEWVRETLLRMSVVAEEPDFELARALAEEGNGYANYIVGMALCEGEGLPKDPVEGIRRLLRAAAEGHGDAFPEIAHALLYGDYRREPKRAVEWLQRGAAVRNRWCLGTLARLQREGKHTEQDLVAAAQGYRAALSRYDWARKELIELLAEHAELREPGDPR